MKKITVVIFLLVFLFPGTVFSFLRASPSVPVSDTVYDDIDVLVAHGLIQKIIVGHRPYTRAEIARLIEIADKGLTRETKQNGKPLSRSTISSRDYLESMLERLKLDFRRELKAIQNKNPRDMEIVALQKAFFHGHFLKSRVRGYFENNAVQYNPLVNFNSGRHYRDGYQTSFETSHYALASPCFSLFFQPRFQLQFARHSSATDNKFFVQQLYASAAVYNFQLDVGRKELIWGQGRTGGLMLSNNARPLDSIQLAPPEAWDFEEIGLFKYSFFFAALGPEYTPKNAYFTGLKLMFQPYPFIEFAVARAIIIGGEGTPEGSVFDYIKEFFLARDDLTLKNLSNSISGFELRGRIPPLRGLEVYTEFYFDDFNILHIPRSFQQDAAVLVGIYMPRLDNKGSLSLRLEGRTFSSIMYEHSMWTTGWSLNGLMMGDPLGADAESFSVYLRKRFNDRFTLKTEFHFEHIDSDTYRGDPEKGRKKIADGVSEKRYRGLAALTYNITPYLSGETAFGYERVQDAGFVKGSVNDNVYFFVNLSFDFTRFKQL